MLLWADMRSQDIECKFPTDELTLCQQNPSFEPKFKILSSTSTSTWIPVPIFGNPPTWNGEDVYIDGTITVNTVFNMYNCNIKMGPNGRIVVISGGQFICSGNKFFGCALWPGIKVEGTGKIGFFLNHIEDAQKAIEIVSADADITIGYNRFNRNVVGIYVDHVASNALIGGNVFDCTSNTYAGFYSEAGIRMLGATLTVGLPIAADPFVRNNFRYQNRGIDCLESSILHLHHADFRCCFDRAIYSDLGTVNVLESQNSSGGHFKNSFIHNFWDISSSGTSLNVRNSYFDGCLTANIYSFNNTLAQFISITNDSIVITPEQSISSNKIGISVERSSGTISGTHNNIEDNLIRILPFGSPQRRSAISVDGFPGTADEMLIQRNTITAGKGGSHPGILMSGFTSTFVDINMRSSGGYSVLRNTILVQNEEDINYSNRWGFYFHGWESPSNFNSLLENKVLGATGNFYDYGCCGFHFKQSGPWTICFNETNNTLRGFHINDYCGGTVFARNEIGDHHTSTIANPSSITAGLLMEVNSQIGIQVCRQNEWLLNNYSPDRGAWHKDLTNFIFSRFDVDPFQANTVPNPIFSGVGWFSSVPGDCDSLGSNECYTSSGYKDSLDKYEEKIMENGSGFTGDNLSGAMAWEQRRQLMGKLLAYPALKETYPEAHVFFEQNIGESAGQFALFNQTLHESMLLPGSLADELTTSQAQIQSILSSLDVYDGAIQDSLQFMSATAEFFSGRKSILQELKETQEYQSQIVEQVQGWRTPALENCEALLETLPDVQVYEQNQKFLCGLEIKKALAQPFSESDYEMLRVIAQQCPAEAGLTIDRAKGWLPKSDALASWPDSPEENACNEGTEERRQFSVSEQELTILPNPAKDFVKIKFSSAFSGAVTVFNLSGMEVLSLTDVEKQTEVTLQTGKLKAGIYYAVAKPASGSSFSSRFTIVK
jgi:Secretion system C-terminal sorting domain